MRLVGIRILLEGQHFLQLVVDDKEAERIKQTWKDAITSNSLGRFLEGITPLQAGPLGNIAWCCRADKVLSLHSFDPALLQQPPQQGMPNQFLGSMRGSGLN